MALIAKVGSGVERVIVGNDVFDFSDGPRQVTHQEAQTLKKVLGSKVTIEEETKRKAKS